MLRYAGICHCGVVYLYPRMVHHVLLVRLCLGSYHPEHAAVCTHVQGVALPDLCFLLNCPHRSHIELVGHFLGACVREALVVFIKDVQGSDQHIH